MKYSLELSAIGLLAAMTVVTLGALVQGTVGFGLAIVAAPFLYEINPALVPGPLMVMGLALGLMSIRRYSKHVQVGAIKYALIGRIPGTFIGAWLLAVASATQMSLILGITILLAVAISMTPYKVRATTTNLAIAGFFSGVFGTSSSISGPPMALIVQNESPNEIRANLGLFFVIGSLMSMVMLVSTGMFGWSSLLYGLSLLPAVWLGSWMAGHASKYTSPETIRRGLLLICSLSGTFSILSAIQK